MGIFDDLTPPKKVWPCAVRDLAATFDPFDAAKLLQMVDDVSWKYLALEQALETRGVSLGQQSIKRHRQRLCSCKKQADNA